MSNQQNVPMKGKLCVQKWFTSLLGNNPRTQCEQDRKLRLVKDVEDVEDADFKIRTKLCFKYCKYDG